MGLFPQKWHGSLVVASLVGLLAHSPSGLAAPEKIPAHFGLDASQCATLVALESTPGEIITSTASSSDPNQIWLGTTERLLRWDFVDGKTTYESKTEKAVLAIRASALSPEVGALVGHPYTGVRTVEMHPESGQTSSSVVRSEEERLFDNTQSYFDGGRLLARIRRERQNSSGYRDSDDINGNLFKANGAQTPYTFNFTSRTLETNNSFDNPEITSWEVQGSPFGPLIAVRIQSQIYISQTSHILVFRAPKRMESTGKVNLEPVATFSYDQTIRSVHDPIYRPVFAFTSVETMLIGTKEGNLELRNLKTPTSAEDPEVGQTLSEFYGHLGSPVTSIAVSEDSRYFASGAEDGTVAVWIPEEKKGYRIEGFGAKVHSLHFTRGERPSLLVQVKEKSQYEDVRTPSTVHRIALPLSP